MSTLPHGNFSPIPLAPPPSDSLARAGASATAQYRAELARDRPRRLAVRAALAAAPGALVGWALDWRVGVGLALLVAAGLALRYHRWSEAASWRKGARGERATARLLAELVDGGHVVLHDRAIGGSHANLDHLVIGPSGVWVVDSKAWHRRTRVHGLNRTLYIGRRPASRLLRGLAFERKAVERALARTVPADAVRAVVAVHGPRLPGLARPLLVENVMLLRARHVPRAVRSAPPTLTPGEVVAAAHTLAAVFPPYLP
ncbi:nuclease-related domain-containing protein [Nonomuraea sp. NPDC050547]|uniref:nuclease-related domain-containing protein n=1 Tax=Nonomuraea sp. NPDC050547 TaxID=3364368 RepID=UPI00379CFF67